MSDIPAQAMQRADLAAEVDGVTATIAGAPVRTTGHLTQPATPQAYDAWPVWVATRPVSMCAAETDWQDKNSHYRADDRSSEHKVGLVLEDKHTLANLSTLRANKATDPFALDPAIAKVTKNGVSDPNAVQKPGDAGGTPKGKKP